MYQVDPSQTKRAGAYSLWMNAPNPMVTFFKKLDVTPLLRFSRKTRLKFNMLLCWCIGLAAERVEEFYLLPSAKRSCAMIPSPSTRSSKTAKAKSAPATFP